MRRFCLYVALGVLGAGVMTACGGGGGGGGSASGFLGGSGNPSVPNFQVCGGECSNSGLSLSESQVMTVVQQAVNEAQARNVSATIAVTDRVGNALAVYEMPGAPQTVAIGSNPNKVAFPGNALEDVPGGANLGSSDPTMASAAAPISARFAALSKAGTAAYLSTQGNAFTTRTASQIIQENFNPGEGRQPGGPLFGVQFSQLSCSDIARKAPFVNAAQGMAGPKRLPLGFSGDSGGVPLYMRGVMVGGVGIEVNGIYSVDRIVNNEDNDVEEAIALAAQRSFEPNANREARFITVMGKSLRYVDGPARRFQSAALGALATTVTGASPVDIPGFFQASDIVVAGTEFLNPASGYMLVNNYHGSGIPAEILVDPLGMPFLGAADPTTSNPRASVTPPPGPTGGLTMQEAGTICVEGMRVANAARAQIRRDQQGPGDSVAVNIAVVDREGVLLAFCRTQDAPVFGTDVSIQKARTAAFFSSAADPADPTATSAAADLLADMEPVFAPLGVKVQSQEVGQYVADLRNFLGDPTALANGIAFSDRSGGNLSRPFFPDGINSSIDNGPLSQPIGSWSPFNTGLQLDLVLNRLLVGILGNPTDPNLNSCTGPTLSEIRNGIQIFPGSVPIFKNGKLVGGMGISGDGVDQDDLVAFQGLKRGGQAINPGSNGIGGMGQVGNAPREIRSDTIKVRPQTGGSAVTLRFVNCPPTPLLNSDQQNICEDN